MRALLDVNVVIALFDPDHAFHERSHEWWSVQVKFGWSSCPITENGVVRIMSNPGYSKKTRFAPGDLISRLQAFIQHTDHEFWPDTLSLLDEKIFSAERIHSSRQLTDFYLLSLAAKHGGMLATFDQSIPISAVKIAAAKNLCVL
jgi:toxin-antitoxin system PIN domain toxin